MPKYINTFNFLLLGEFVINNILCRYVFGNGPCQDWGSVTTDALTKVRIWRQKFSDETRVADGLMKTYKMATTDKIMHPFDVGMVAFAVFGFLV